MNKSINNNFQIYNPSCRNYLSAQLPAWGLFFILLATTFSANAANYEILITKSSQELIIKKAKKIIKKFHIALGSGGEGPKRKWGDKKTPVGTYHIIDFNQDSKFHFFMQLDYPNLLDAWYGYKNEVIDAGAFKKIATAFKNNKIPPQNTELGGFIGIHGIGHITDKKMIIHTGTNWTEGCIAMTNEDIEELRQYVGIGTRVVIRQ